MNILIFLRKTIQIRLRRKRIDLRRRRRLPLLALLALIALKFLERKVTAIQAIIRMFQFPEMKVSIILVLYHKYVAENISELQTLKTKIENVSFLDLKGRE